MTAQHTSTQLRAINNTLPYVLRIGRRAKVNVRDLVDASSAYSIERELSGEGASTFPDGSVRIGRTVYRISYNGRVWDGEALVMEAA